MTPLEFRAVIRKAIDYARANKLSGLSPEGTVLLVKLGDHLIARLIDAAESVCHNHAGEIGKDPAITELAHVCSQINQERNR